MSGNYMSGKTIVLISMNGSDSRTACWYCPHRHVMSILCFACFCASLFMIQPAGRQPGASLLHEGGHHWTCELTRGDGRLRNDAKAGAVPIRTSAHACKLHLVVEIRNQRVLSILRFYEMKGFNSPFISRHWNDIYCLSSKQN